MRRVDVRIAEPLYRELHAHLFPGDRDEHAAVLVCGVAETASGTRLLVREVALALDGVDFVPSDRAYRKLTSRFVAKWASHCADRNLCYLAVHNHGGRDSVSFSGDDMLSHENGYPALLDIVGDGPVGALVFAENAVAGDIWFPEGRSEIATLTVVGSKVAVLRPSPEKSGSVKDRERFDRSIRLFGEEGQAILGGIKVTIIGVGGGGSLLNEWISRLGVGSITAIDPDVIETTNLSRVVDSSDEDVRRRLPKVAIARRVAKRANPNVRYLAVKGDVTVESVAKLASDSDLLILAGDNFTSRNVFNALVHQYLIPGFHVGVNIQPDEKTGEVSEIKVESRTVLPFAGGGCLRCEGLIPPTKLQLEALTPEERKAQGYFGGPTIDDVPAPSVMALNVLSGAQAATDLMMMFTGLFHEGVNLGSHRYFPMDRSRYAVAYRVPELCRFCSVEKKTVYAKGDRAELPCRPGSYEVVHTDPQGGWLERVFESIAGLFRR